MEKNINDDSSQQPDSKLNEQSTETNIVSLRDSSSGNVEDAEEKKEEATF